MLADSTLTERCLSVRKFADIQTSLAGVISFNSWFSLRQLWQAEAPRLSTITALQRFVPGYLPNYSKVVQRYPVVMECSRIL